MTQKPTLDETGTLTGVCTKDSTHTDPVTLPALNKTDYEYRNVKAAACGVEGKDRYTIWKNLKAYAFDVTLDALQHNYQNKVCSLCQDHADFTYTVDGSSCTVTGFKGDPNETVIDIPSTIKGAMVYKIDAEAFKDLTNITEIKLPENVTVLNDKAFAGCVNLKKVDLPLTLARYNATFKSDAFENCPSIDTVNVPLNLLTKFPLYDLKNVALKDGNTISTGLFKDCTELDTVLLPSTLNTIGANAFENCYNLTSIALPQGVTGIGTDAFKNCYKLVEVRNASSLNIAVGSEENGGIAYRAKAVIGANEDGILKTTNDGFVYFADQGAQYLLHYKGGAANVTLPSDLEGGSYTIYNYAFYNRTDIMKITVPEGVTAIQERSFLDAIKLYEVFNYSDLVIDKSYTNGYIGHYAYNIQNFKVPDPAPSDESAIIENSDFIFISVVDKYYLVDYVGTAIDIALPENCNSHPYAIGEHAFANRTDLNSITIPDTVTEIGAAAFTNCTSEIVFGGAPTITTIGADAFRGYAGTQMVLPDSVVTIGIGAFRDCENLQGITLSAHLETISEYAFYHCSSLSSVTLPATLRTLAERAFSECGLESVVIAFGLEAIGDNVFNNCAALTDVTLPASIKSIEANAFKDCVALENVFYAGGIADWMVIEFKTDFILIDGTDNELRYDITYANPMRYAQHIFMNGAYNTEITEIVIPTTITGINQFTFYGFNNITRIDIHDRVEYIGEGAFADCSSLRSVELPVDANVKQFVFAGCSSLERIRTPQITVESQVSVDFQSFKYYYQPFGSLFGAVPANGMVAVNQHYYSMHQGNRGEDKAITYYLPGTLTEVTLTDEFLGRPLNDIRDYTFENCSMLQNVIFPEHNTIATIGKYAFAGVGISAENFANLHLDAASKTAIGEYAFKDSHIVTASKLTKRLTELSEGMFYNCVNLTDVYIPEDITGIPDYAFYNCTSLVRIDTKINGSDTAAQNGDAFFHNTIQSIGKSAFANCTGIQNITFENFATEEAHLAFTIDLLVAKDYAFYGCSVKNLTAPAYVTKYISASEDVTVTQGVTVTVNSTEMCGMPDYFYFNDTSSQNNANRAKFNARTFTITESAGIQSIPHYLFTSTNSKNHKLESITLPSTIQKVLSYAFLYCTALRSLTVNKLSTEWNQMVNQLRMPGNGGGSGSYKYQDITLTATDKEEVLDARIFYLKFSS